MTLLLDLVVSGPDVTFSAPDSTHTISGVSGPGGVAITGRKIFTAPLAVGRDLAPRPAPALATSTGAELVFSGGTVSSGSGAGAGHRVIRGDVVIDGDLHSEDTFLTIAGKYEFDPAIATHELKTKFTFGGSVSVTRLDSVKVAGRDWATFVADVLPKTGSV